MTYFDIPIFLEHYLYPVATAVTVAFVTAISGYRHDISERLTAKANVNKAVVWRLEEIKELARILIIDDNDYAHYGMLDLDGFKFDRKTEIDPGTSKSMDSSYDLLILDYRGVKDAFGATTGIEALALLRRYNPWIPIVVYTNFLGEFSEEEQGLLNKHSSEAIEKSVTFPEFHERVVQLIRVGRTFEYLHSRLRTIGVRHADELLTSVLLTLKVPAEIETDGSAFSHDQAVAILKKAIALKPEVPRRNEDR